MTLFDYLDKHPVWSLVFLSVLVFGAICAAEEFGKWRRR